DATNIRRRVLMAFEMAEHETDPARRRTLLTFVVVGGGPTGVEMAGQLAEIARMGLRHEFRHIDPTDAQILLVEASDRILSTYPAELPADGRQSLEQLGVQVRNKSIVSHVAADHVIVDFAGGKERIDTQTVVWAAGVEASTLNKQLAAATDAKLD